MGSRRGVATLVFGAVLLLAAILLSAPSVPDLAFENATAPTTIQRELSAGNWLVFADVSNGPSAITRVQLTSSGGLSWDAQILSPSTSLVAQEAQTIDTVDGSSIPVATFALPHDDLWTITISSNRPTNVMITPSLNQLNQLGIAVVIAMSGALTMFVGLVVVINDNVQRSRKSRPGVPITQNATGPLSR